MNKLLNTIKETEPYIESYKKVYLLRNKLTKIPVVKEVTMDEIVKLEQQYTRLKEQINIIKCPNCNVSLRYLNQRLVMSDVEPISEKNLIDLRETINHKKEQLQNLNSRINLEKQLKNLEKNIPGTIPQEIPKFPKSNDVLKCIHDLEHIKILEKPKISYENAKIITEIQRLQKELDNSMKPSVIRNISELRNTITTIRNEINKNKELYDKYMRLKKEIKALRQQQNEIEIDDSINSQYQTLKIKIHSLNDVIQNTKINKITQQKKKLVSTAKVTVNDIENKILNLEKIKNIAIDAECEYLESIIENINITMGQFLADVFNDPILVQINLRKKLKSKKIYVPTVNITIDYDGKSYESIYDLSGGEIDRISIGLLVGLHSILPREFSLIMLDEAIESLNNELRSQCLSSIRKILPGITILVINHEDSSYRYDNVITV